MRSHMSRVFLFVNSGRQDADGNSSALACHSEEPLGDEESFNFASAE